MTVKRRSGISSPGRHVTSELPVYVAADGLFKSSHGCVLIQDLHAFVGGVGEAVPVCRSERLHRRLLHKHKQEGSHASAAASCCTVWRRRYRPPEPVASSAPLVSGCRRWRGSRPAESAPAPWTAALPMATLAAPSHPETSTRRKESNDPSATPTCTHTPSHDNVQTQWVFLPQEVAHV